MHLFSVGCESTLGEGEGVQGNAGESGGAVLRVRYTAWACPLARGVHEYHHCFAVQTGSFFPWYSMNIMLLFLY